jgi:hypothetical protein
MHQKSVQKSYDRDSPPLSRVVQARLIVDACFSVVSPVRCVDSLVKERELNN